MVVLPQVRVKRLVTAGTVEVKILNKSRAKDNMDLKVIQAGKFNNSSTDSDRRCEPATYSASIETTEVVNIVDVARNTRSDASPLAVDM